MHIDPADLPSPWRVEDDPPRPRDGLALADRQDEGRHADGDGRELPRTELLVLGGLLVLIAVLSVVLLLISG